MPLCDRSANSIFCIRNQGESLPSTAPKSPAKGMPNSRSRRERSVDSPEPLHQPGIEDARCRTRVQEEIPVLECVSKLANGNHQKVAVDF